jgi:hypothetical protein
MLFTKEKEYNNNNNFINYNELINKINKSNSAEFNLLETKSANEEIFYPTKNLLGIPFNEISSKRVESIENKNSFSGFYLKNINNNNNNHIEEDANKNIENFIYNNIINKRSNKNKVFNNILNNDNDYDNDNYNYFYNRKNNFYKIYLENKYKRQNNKELLFKRNKLIHINNNNIINNSNSLYKSPLYFSNPTNKINKEVLLSDYIDKYKEENFNQKYNKDKEEKKNNNNNNNNKNNNLLTQNNYLSLEDKKLSENNSLLKINKNKNEEYKENKEFNTFTYLIFSFFEEKSQSESESQCESESNNNIENISKLNNKQKIINFLAISKEENINISFEIHEENTINDLKDFILSRIKEKFKKKFKFFKLENLHIFFKNFYLIGERKIKEYKNDIDYNDINYLDIIFFKEKGKNFINNNNKNNIIEQKTKKLISSKRKRNSNIGINNAK